MARALLSLMIAGMVTAACATSKPAAAVVEPPPKASAIEAPPAAVRVPDAPGLNVEDLAARLRDALARTSGVDVVDEASVRRELAACVEAPCPEVVAEKYKNAAFVVGSSVSRIGAVFLATVRVQRGAEEVARATAQAADASVALTTAGHDAGAALRKKLVAEGAAPVEGGEG